MDHLKQFIEKYIQVPDEEWQIIQKAFERNEFNKNEIILEEGYVCKYFYFLESGLIRYFTNNDGNEVTKYFTVSPYCFTSRQSFRNQEPAQESIQALEKTVVWQITLKQANDLLVLDSWNNFTRQFVHEVQNFMEELLLDLKTLTAEDLYEKISKKHPEVIHRIPLKHLSTFLGIAPQSLSRIRKNITIKNKN